MRCNRWKARQAGRRGAVVGLALMLPLLMGGCPEFRDDVLNVANTATQGLVLGGLDEQEAVDNVTRGILSAAIDLFFDQFRDDRNR